MSIIRFRLHTLFVGVGVATLLVACATPPALAPVATTPVIPACKAAAAGDPLIGNWLSVRSQKGVAGELRTLFTLRADGTMAYTELLKRSKQPSQGLTESGCWHRDQQTLEIQTQESNGVQVNLQDPIYHNRYQIKSINAKALNLQGPNAENIKARNMSPGYRLPF